jgi:predicted nucleic acid-binding protein
MIGSDKVFFDTSPFIYLLENHPRYYLPVAEFITVSLAERQATFVTSVLSIAEFGVKPKRTGKLGLIADFENLTQELKFQFFDINHDIAQLSSTLRANYTFLKGMDSLQLATSIYANCTQFFTSDKNLQTVKEIKVILAEDLLLEL